MMVTSGTTERPVRISSAHSCEVKRGVKAYSRFGDVQNTFCGHIKYAFKFLLVGDLAQRRILQQEDTASLRAGRWNRGGGRGKRSGLWERVGCYIDFAPPPSAGGFSLTG